jgi:hypothetical protein
VLKTSKPAARRTQAVGISDKKPDAAIMNIPGRTIVQVCCLRTARARQEQVFEMKDAAD